MCALDPFARLDSFVYSHSLLCRLFVTAEWSVLVVPVLCSVFMFYNVCMLQCVVRVDVFYVFCTCIRVQRSAFSVQFQFH